ncbi:glutathione transferase GST 23-like [Humulus lupulus]|uniref:glutathione transferase GST 23-like n=1 Tax=Humulus lupulus TaxID=3486 RepID=UPI002B40302C|nr:glutathione transferase GST 23-like [Humulus lupulus]
MADIDEVKLFRTWSTPFALRIVWALQLKGVQYETIYEDLSNKSDALLLYNPIYKKVPVLLHNSKPICESLVILEYIDETWNQHPHLLPQDPYDRAIARFWAKFGETEVLPAVWDTFSKAPGKEQEEAYSRAVEKLKLLDEELKGKKLFGGEEIGMVDIALGWMANLVSVFEEIIGFKLIEEQTMPRLTAWMVALDEIPVVKENWPDRDKLVTKFAALHQNFLSKEAPRDK